MSKKVILSAAQPSNQLTLGNYIGAIKNWVTLQEEYDSIFFIVDLHAITFRQDPEKLREQTYLALATYLACGLDPKKSLLFVQSQVPEHAELSWILNCNTYLGELERMTQFKDKSGKEGASIPAGLLNYPVLMAADILLYNANLIPVGADQKQHIELARDIAIRMNHLYGADLFVIPEPHIPKQGAKIMSLQDPTKKMSKSDSDLNGAIFLNDSPKEIEKKLKRAVTDSGSEITDDDSKPGIKNLLTIQSVLTGKPIAQLVNEYAGKQYGHLKIGTAEIITAALEPFQKEIFFLMQNRGYLDEVMKAGRDRARDRAGKVLSEVKKRVGFAGY